MKTARRNSDKGAGGWRGRGLLLLTSLALAVVGLVPASSSAAVLIIVTTDEDEFGENTGDCSLREAIRSANKDFGFGGCPAGNGADTVRLEDGETYLLTRSPSGEDFTVTGDLDILDGDIGTTDPTDGHLTIDVADEGEATVDASGLDLTFTAASKTSKTSGALVFIPSDPPADRVFDVKSGIVVSMIGITITGGSVPSLSSPQGGGIRVSGATLSLDGVTVVENIARFGGGIYAGAGATTTITDSTIQGNDANSDSNGLGGGIYNGSSDTLTVTGSLITDNVACGVGSTTDPCPEEPTGGGNGGGIWNTGTATITDTEVSQNRADWYGGGIWTGTGSPSFSIQQSTIDGNHAAFNGGGIYNDDDDVFIEDSTISNNTAANGYGGGIYTQGGDGESAGLEALNSTISRNHAEIGDEQVPGAGVGGGIYATGDQLAFYFHSVTVARNEAETEEAGGNIAIGNAGPEGTTGFIENTIVAEGEPQNCSLEQAEDDIDSQGFNLTDEPNDDVETDTCGLDPVSDFLGEDPNLGPLQQNPPGTTETHALLPGSDAIDRSYEQLPDQASATGPPAVAQPVTGECPDFDQRGVPRLNDQGEPIQDGDGDGTPLCDVGAYERRPSEPGPTGGGGTPPPLPGPPTPERVCDILGTPQDDILIGTNNSEILCGLAGDDVIRGLGGPDALVGDPGDDILDGGLDNDAVDGGTGEDTGDYRGGPGPVNGNLKQGTVVGVGASTDTVVGVENLFGSAFNDVLRGDGGPNLLKGNAGNDLVQGRGNADRLRGGGGNDRLGGGNGADSVKGGPDNDLAKGHKADDVVGGGNGNDRLRGGRDNDRLRGFKGNDHLNGHNGVDDCDGGTGTNTLVSCEL